MAQSRHSKFFALKRWFRHDGMSAPIHIQHVLLSLRPGGLENGVVNVVNRLDPERFRSSVCCLQASGEFAQRITRSDVPVHEMDLRKGNDPMMPLRLARLFRRTGTDIVHTRNAEAFFYGAVGARMAGIGTVIHSEHGRTLPDTFRRMALQRWLAPLANMTFAVSEQLKLDLVKHVRLAKDRIHVIYNGVDLGRFASTDRVRARALLGVDQATTVIGSVGRLAAVKNYKLLVRAIAAIPGVDLVLIGDGPQRGQIEAEAAAAGICERVRLLGHREDVAELLPGLDVFVLPSLSEGMSNTLLEAMACGLPVVASRVGGNVELVRNGVTGILFPSEDAEALSTALRPLCADAGLRATMGLQGKRRAREQFGIDTMIDAYQSMYARAIARFRGR